METETLRILQSVLEDIEANRTISLNHADRYGGVLGDYKVQFEGEDDLLHCSVQRVDQSPLDVEQAHRVVEPFFGCCPKGLVWFQPAEFSAHYFIGHDDFLRAHREAQG
ncbi:MAG: hypothetical protein KIT45_02905 [Fimbriimonadia bacterium]|nr:hypothetical protein [Fimbriimonadia bacterium]